jgi:hypothetical protein
MAGKDVGRAFVEPFSEAALASSHHPLNKRDRLVAEGLVIVYVAIVAGLARYSAIPYLLFPELGALAYDVLIRPWGRWASQPVRLILTPAITAVIGTAVTRRLQFGALSAVIIVASSIAVIAVMRSAITPAMSAGVLPLVLGVKSWMYPLGMTATLVVLSAVAVLWRKYNSSRPAEPNLQIDVEDVLESPPHGKYWALILLIFVAVTAELARVSGLRFMLFPPLVTIAYEMLGHTDTCPWSKRPAALPLCCFLVAGAGLLAFHATGTGIGLAFCSVVTGIVLLRAFDLHMPPAMAVGLLPAVMAAPDLKFPFAVLAGTVALTLVFLGCQRVWTRA